MERVKLPAGKSISIDINLAAARRLTKELGVTLCDPAASARLGGPERYELLPEILTVLCGDEIGRNWPELAGQPEAILGFLDEQLIAETDHMAAHGALTKEWSDFLGRRGHHQHSRSVGNLTRFVASDLEAVEAGFASATDKAERMVAERTAAATPGASQTSGQPKSGESTQTSTPSAGSA